MRLRNGSPDRRRHERGTATSEPSRTHLTSMIIGTFREMPGLSLHANQAARLFGVRQSTCAVVLEDLVADGKLRRTPDGQFVRAELDSPRMAGAVYSAGRHEHGISRRGH
jgi:hypothetical protein